MTTTTNFVWIFVRRAIVAREVGKGSAVLKTHGRNGVWSGVECVRGKTRSKQQKNVRVAVAADDDDNNGQPLLHRPRDKLPSSSSCSRSVAADFSRMACVCESMHAHERVTELRC